MKKYMKIIGVILACAALMLMMAMPATAAMTDGLVSAKDTLLDGVKSIIDTVVVPIGLVVVVCVFLFNLFGFLKKRREGEGYNTQVVAMALTAAIGVLLGTWYVWGPVMLG